MAEGVSITLRDVASRRRAHECVKDCPDGWSATFAPAKRSSDQNALLWARLGELSRKVPWHGQKLTPENWKDVLTAALKRQAVVPGIDGGFVVLGTSTRRMNKSEMGELLDLMDAFAAQQGVTWAVERSVEEMAR